MLSYQHAYHAGSRADVHKHIALVLLLRRLQRKDASLCYVDSQAGRGVYDLESEAARKTREAEAGILRLAGYDRVAGAPRHRDSAAGDVPAGVRDYLDLVAAFNAPGSLRYYPGSLALARALLREHDRAALLELHPRELAALRKSVRGDGRVGVHARDCYEGLPALLPPAVRRGLVLLDPSYEVKSEFGDIANLLARALGRWAGGVYLLWYPLLPEARHELLLGRLAEMAPTRTLISEYRFSAAPVGLLGSGLVIVNTPWQLDRSLADAMRYVAAVLDPDGAGRHEQRRLDPAAAR